MLNTAKSTAKSTPMNKTELIDEIAERTQVSKKDVGAVINGFQDVVMDTLAKDDSVILTGFGTFSAKQRAERQGRNPATGAAITIPAARVASFKVGKIFKEHIS